MLATEIDEANRNVAQQNIEAIGLSKRVKIVGTDSTSRHRIPRKELDRFERYVCLLSRNSEECVLIEVTLESTS